MGVKSLHTSKIIQLVQHIFLLFRYLCTKIIRNKIKQDNIDVYKRQHLSPMCRELYERQDKGNGRHL